MIERSKLTVLFSPWWQSSKYSSLQTTLIISANLATQFAIHNLAMPLNPPNDDSSCTDAEQKAQGSLWNSIIPVVTPVIANAANVVLFHFIQQRVADKLLKSLQTRILLGTNAKHAHSSYASIAMIQHFADTDTLSKKDIENISTYVNDASTFCTLAGEITNVIPLALYANMAYLSLPQAQNLLYAAGTITLGGCLLQRYVFKKVVAADKSIKTKDMEIHAILSRSIQHFDAVVQCGYQQRENLEINRVSVEKNLANSQVNSAVSFSIVIESIMSICIGTLTISVAGQLYPELKGTSAITTFGYAMTLFSVTLLKIIEVIGNKYPKASIGIDKLYDLNLLLNEIESLNSQPYTTQVYEAQLPKNVIISFENLKIIVPSKKVMLAATADPNVVDSSNYYEKISRWWSSQQNLANLKPKTIREKIAEVLLCTSSQKLDLPNNFSLREGTIYRFTGKSGAGKSTIIKVLLGLWPYTKGDISFACKREEILCMPQKDIFIKGTLLQNIFYPEDVPTCFNPVNPVTSKNDIKYNLNNDQALWLIKTMQQIGLDAEITSLGKFKDWGSESYLSQGMEKRFSFLRILVKAWLGKVAPKIIILDEATSSVDPINAACMENLVYRLKQKFPQLCILYIKHDQEINLNEFNPAQQELIASDPNFHNGLTDCKHIEIKGNNLEAGTTTSPKFLIPSGGPRAARKLSTLFESSATAKVSSLKPLMFNSVAKVFWYSPDDPPGQFSKIEQDEESNTNPKRQTKTPSPSESSKKFARLRQKSN